jgi:hypothetical protein
LRIDRNSRRLWGIIYLLDWHDSVAEQYAEQYNVSVTNACVSANTSANACTNACACADTNACADTDTCADGTRSWSNCIYCIDLRCDAERWFRNHCGQSNGWFQRRGKCGVLDQRRNGDCGQELHR